ncbi:MAG: sigma-70 family RNA polymerase sigma factor [Ruminococcus sp.]|nr:sigma-70 family RNA polymerase sigma factor [Ruminococcus sp.]
MIFCTLISDDDCDLFEQIYLDNRQMAFQIAKRILHDASLAEDAVSEAFLCIAEIFQKIHHLNSHKMQYYIVVTVRNTCFNMLKNGKTDLLSYEDTIEYAASESVDFEYMHLKGCISRLSATDREILYLRANLGLSYHEIAVTLNISSAAARQRYRYAKSNLKKLLSEGEDVYE